MEHSVLTPIPTAVEPVETLTPVVIYALVDPFRGVVRYVGKSENPASRFERHLKGALETRELQTTPSYTEAWILNLHDKNAQPFIVTLETCNSANWRDRERFWVNVFKRQGQPLTNRALASELDRTECDQDLLEQIRTSIIHPKLPIEPGVSIEESFPTLAMLASLDQGIPEFVQQLSNEDLINLYIKIDKLKSVGWRVRAICAGLVWQRAVDKRRSYNRSTDDESLKAAVTKHANKAGVTPSTIRVYYRLFKLMMSLPEDRRHTIFSTLPDKKFFLVALGAEDSVGALELFLAQKQSRPRFRPTDADRFLKVQGLTKAQVKTRTIELVRQKSPEAAQHVSDRELILQDIDIIKQQILPRHTNDEIIRIHKSYMDELQEYADDALFDQDVSAALIKAWEEGNHTEAQLASATSIPIDTVSREMGMLAGLGTFISVPSPTGSQRWHKVGTSLPQELRAMRHQQTA